MLLRATLGVTSPAPRPDCGALADPSEKRKARPDGQPLLRVSHGAHPARLAACKRHVFRRTSGTSSGVQAARLPACKRHFFRRASSTSSGVQAARLSACNQRVFWCVTGKSCGAQTAHFAKRNQRVSRRANDASRGAQLASLQRATVTFLQCAFCAVQRSPTRARARDIERLISTLRLSVRPRARFENSRSVSILNRSVSESGF